MSEQHDHHVIGGYKATLANPKTSEEAKAHARQAINEYERKKNSGSGGTEHDHRVAGGYKAALHNPNVSQEAKQHAKEVLKEHNF
ncbi:hypothetical protein IAS59_000371 [Cryptococcus gattii]